jgi:hypothetical protein
VTFKPYKQRPHASTKDVVTRAFDASTWCIKEIAAVLGRSPTQTTAYSDPATDDELTLDQARRLAEVDRAAAAVFAEDFAAKAGGAYVPHNIERESLIKLAERLSPEFGEGIGALIAAAVDPEKRAVAEKELSDVRRGVDVALAMLARPLDPDGGDVVNLRRTA